jgi:hypothetical protein
MHYELEREELLTQLQLATKERRQIVNTNRATTFVLLTKTIPSLIRTALGLWKGVQNSKRTLEGAQILGQ